MSEFGKWIDVKDELPPKPENHEDKSYLVTVKSQTIPWVMHWNGTSFYNSLGMGRIMEADDVIAWTPLPEPYKPADPIETLRKEVENNASAIKNIAKDIIEIMKNEGRFKTELNGIYKDMATIVNQISDLARHQEEHRIEIARIKMKMEENDEE